jgi:hypothetical protein
MNDWRAVLFRRDRAKWSHQGIFATDEALDLRFA